MGHNTSAASSASATPPSASTVTITPIPTATWTSLGLISFTPIPTTVGPELAAYFIMSLGYLQSYLIEGFIEGTLAGWTESMPSTYTSGSETITWSHNGNTWTWTIIDGTNTIVITVTSISTGWSLTVTENGLQWLAGSINSGGTSGTATLSDPTAPTQGSITSVWIPASAPYNYQFTITATSAYITAEAGRSATIGTVVLYTNSAGTAWTWTYSDNGTPPGSLSGHKP
jgi:hypothetical protein